MDLDLITGSRRADGVFSQLVTHEGEHLVCMLLEHAYPGEKEGEWTTKIPRGAELECVRGKHRLAGMTQDFETFEVIGVEGHSGLLFHWGNLNIHSKGCALTGDAIAEYKAGAAPVEMVTNSRAAFARFMKTQEGCDKFILRTF